MLRAQPHTTTCQGGRRAWYTPGVVAYCWELGARVSLTKMDGLLQRLASTFNMDFTAWLLHGEVHEGLRQHPAGHMDERVLHRLLTAAVQSTDLAAFLAVVEAG